MAKESRSDRWQYQPDAVARQPEPAPNRAAQPVLAFPEPGLTEIVRAARSALKASAIAIAVDTGAGMVCRARAGESAPDLGAPVDRERGITGECVSTGSVVRCTDAANHPKIDPAFSERRGVRSILVAPLLRNSAVVGVIVAFFPVRHAYTDVAVTRLEEFAREAVARVFGPQEEPSPASNDEPPIAEPSVRGAVRGPADVAEQPGTTAEAVPLDDELTPEFLPALRRFPPTVPWIAACVVVGIMSIALVLLSSVDGNRARDERRAPATASAALDKTRTAAEAGDLAAEYTLAHAYRNGAGVVADPGEADKWLRRAAEGGNPDAQMELAATLEHQPATRPVEAYTWYVIAWQSGKKEAASAIARLTPRLSARDIAQVRYKVGKEYASGQALRHDPISAYVWYSLAEAAGDAKARDRLRELEAQLTPQQLEEAKSRSAAWVRSHAAPNTAASR